MAKLNVVRSGASVCSFNNEYLFCFGGLNNDGMIEEMIERFSLRVNRWDVFTLVNYTSYLPLIETSCIQINNNQILILGGSSILTTEGDFENTTASFILNLVERCIINLSSSNEILANPINLGDSLISKNGSIYGTAKVLREINMFGPANRLLL